MVEEIKKEGVPRTSSLLKAHTFIGPSGGRSTGKQESELSEMPQIHTSFMSVAKLMTNLLSELNQTYVTGDSLKD